MLQRSHRFHGHQTVRRVYKAGRVVRGAALSLHIVDDENLKSGKAAVVVSKKVNKSAVGRNRIRRRIYEIIRRHQAEFTHPAELVLTVYTPDLGAMPASELEKTVLELLDKAHLR